MLAGGTMMATGVGAPAGAGMFAAGAAFATWDLVEGINKGEDFAEKVVDEIIDKHFEELDELDKELEELEKKKEKSDC